jgi:hypothetical protein
MVPSPDSPTQPTLPTEPTSATGRRGDDDASRKSSRIHVGERARTHGFPGSSETPRTRAAQVQVQCSAGAAAFRTPEVQWPALPMRRNSPKSWSSKRAFAAHRTLFRPPACEFCEKEFEQIPLDSAPTLPVRIGLRLDLGTTSHARMPVARSDGIR